MFQRSTLELSQAGGVGALVLDYLSNKKELRTFYSHAPTPDGLRSFLAEQSFAATDRKILTDVLRKQATLVNNTSSKSKENIELLADKKTLTVTTGHQLCLFTGPLYFIYKIATTINLAKQLAAISPGYRFVPVFWLASEDHDFDEISHFDTPAGSVVWRTNQTGAVGRFSTHELETMATDAATLFGGSDNGRFLADLFRKSYSGHPTLSAATRYLVNALFGEEGVVIIDADDRSLKSMFRDEMQKDLYQQLTYSELKKSVSALEADGYEIQVRPRQTNLFLLNDHKRVRINKNNDGSFTAGDQNIAAAQMRSLLDDAPEKFSPNVSLRGVYQQKILPNAAYVGGPGELSYWLEYKKMFDAYGVPFPVLVPRATFTIVDNETASKLQRYKMKVADALRSFDELAKRYMRSTDSTTNADSEKDSIREIYAQLRDKVAMIDKSLLKHVGALEERHLSSIDGLIKKTDRALRRKSETDLQRLRTIQSSLRPDNIPQERHFNFSTFYLRYGSSFLREILRNADPFENKHVILEEQKS